MASQSAVPAGHGAGAASLDKSTSALPLNSGTSITAWLNVPRQARSSGSSRFMNSETAAAVRSATGNRLGLVSSRIAIVIGWTSFLKIVMGCRAPLSSI